VKNAIIKLIVVASIAFCIVFSWTTIPAFAFNFSSVNTLVAINSNETVDNTIYKVLVNYEEQYSIWPADREIPVGWRAEGKQGTKPECLAYIEEVWTDMRPLSLRKAMESQTQ